MSTQIAAFFPVETLVDARDLQEGDTLRNGDKVVEVRPVEAVFPGEVTIVLEVEGMTNTMRVPGHSKYRITRQMPVMADWQFVDEFVAETPVPLAA